MYVKGVKPSLKGRGFNRINFSVKDADFGKPKFKKRGKCSDGFYQRTDSFHQVDATHVRL